VTVRLRTSSLWRILGCSVQWNTQAYSFSIVTLAIEIEVPTKKTSATARFYDLIGGYGFILLTIKILMQKLCLSGIGWDDPISAEYLLEWKN